jgi:hypothetical protein
MMCLFGDACDAALRNDDIIVDDGEPDNKDIETIIRTF